MLPINAQTSLTIQHHQSTQCTHHTHRGVVKASHHGRGRVFVQPQDPTMLYGGINRGVEGIHNVWVCHIRCAHAEIPHRGTFALGGQQLHPFGIELGQPGNGVLRRNVGFVVPEGSGLMIGRV